ncbi:MAG TPA: VWA domain-containing protein, partial [bacterium]|nr:VWA domain-containing protein [bacterium]
MLRETLQKEAEQIAQREQLFPPEWHPSDQLPIPGDILPVDQQGLADRGVFPEKPGIWPSPETDLLPDDQAREFDRKVVEIAQSVGQEKLENRWRRPPSTDRGMEPYGIGLGDGMSGGGKAGDLPAKPLGGRDIAPINIEASGFSPTVPTGVIALDRSEQGVPLSGSRVPVAVSPVGQKDLSRHESIDQFLEAFVETYHDAQGQGYFRVILRPNAKSRAMKVLPKDIVYVLDASGSIGRRVFQEMKTAVIQAIMRLPSTDRFNVLGFQSDVEFLWPGLVEASDVNKALAASFVQKLRPSGMTNIYRSLSSVGDLGRSAERPFLVALFSDGRANIGVTNNREIINDLSTKTGSYTSIFSFGVGSRVNHYLMDLLSYRNKGRFDYAQQEETIER